MIRLIKRRKQRSSTVVLGLTVVFMIFLLSMSGNVMAFVLDPGNGGGGGGPGGGSGGGGGGALPPSPPPPPRYAVILHGFLGKPSDMNVIRDQISSYYGGADNILMVGYYSSDVILGTYNVFTPIGPYKNSNNVWQVSPSDKSLANYVQQEIKNWLSNKPDSTSPAGTVDIIAHSMGGLVVKSMLTDYFNNGNIVAGGKTFTIRKIITLGTPHQGTTMARFAELLYNMALNLVLPGSGTMREFLRHYIETLDSGLPAWLVDKLVELAEDVIKKYLGIDPNAVLQDAYNSVMAALGFTRSQAEQLLDYTGITQIQMMIPGHSFLQHINIDPTPGPTSISWYSIVGTRQYFSINGFVVPQMILDFAFKQIPASYSFDASVNLRNIPLSMPASLAVSYAYVSSPYKYDFTFKVSWGTINPDKNWFTWTTTFWPDNDGVANTFSARNVGSSIYTFQYNHYEVYAGSSALNTISTILT